MCNISFEGISEIMSSKLVTHDMKKNSKPRVNNGTTMKGATGNERKRFSMENIRSIRLGSDRSTKRKRRSQDNQESNNVTKGGWKTPFK